MIWNEKEPNTSFSEFRKWFEKNNSLKAIKIENASQDMSIDMESIKKKFKESVSNRVEKRVTKRMRKK